MLYTSEVTGKSYKTVKELQADEKEFKAAEAMKEKEVAEKDARIDELGTALKDYHQICKKAAKAKQDAWEAYVTLRDKFIKDYGDIEIKYTEEDGKATVEIETDLDEPDDKVSLKHLKDEEPKIPSFLDLLDYLVRKR